MSTTRFLIAVAVILATQAPAHADPLLTLTAKQIGPFQGYFTLQDAQIEIDAQISNVPAGSSFGSLAFDITLTAPNGDVLTHPTTSAYAWKPNNPFWTNDAGDTVEQIFQINGDKGVSSTDLQGILAIMANDSAPDANGFGTDAADPRLPLLQTTPFKLGTFKVQWNASGFLPLPPLEPGEHTILDPYTIGFANVQFALLDDSTAQFGQTFASPADFNAPSLKLSETPEPTSLTLAAFGLCALLHHRKRP